MKKMKKILIIGSGGLSIGQAGEFDYSGSQAIKAIKEEGIKTVLINPNVATIQTTPGLADKIYLLPITEHHVTEVIKKERPQGLAASFGGQIALNTAVELHKSGTLKKYGVQALGTPIKSIMDTEDRERFIKRLNEIGVKSPKSFSATSSEQAKIAALKIGFPLMIRAAYALGGKGSKVVTSAKDLDQAVKISLADSPQILIEEYLGGWKEVEYEVMRDAKDNCITVCNMENFDPLGIHTGESIVVTPSQTLTNQEYHFLRSISIKVIRHLKIIGECNIQFALSTNSLDYRVIEVNARLSRSSALASKATGYPIAFIAAKLALGKSLSEIQNRITKKTKACFEPALDYVVVKMPRWDLKKFEKVSRVVGPEMKSVGEVMALGRTFEEAIQKACRMVNTGMRGLVANGITIGDTNQELTQPTDLRIFAVERSLKRGYSPEHISRLTGIDLWFIKKIQNIIDVQQELKKTKTLSRELLIKAKKHGFSDSQIAYITKKTIKSVRDLRVKYKIHPWKKQIDTLAAEYPANTNYLYLTYNADEDDSIHRDTKSKYQNSVIVLGSGPYSIGSSVEFDWCCVTAGQTLQREGSACIMINSNPETVSTDYDMFETLYFEELTLETIIEIYRKEKPLGVVISVGGQIPNNLALPLLKAGIKILGTDPKNIDRAEDRHKFSNLLDTISVDQPEWRELKDIKGALRFAKKVSYPVLIRPSYVLSGAAMRVASSASQLKLILEKAGKISKKHPVVISKFIEGAKEIEIDAVAQKGEILAYAISEHVENAGVHSGDATLVFPAQKLYIETIRRIKRITRQIAKELQINGPFNIQYLAKDNDIKVIECNLRASRTFPFISKVLNTNLIELATNVIAGKKSMPLRKSVFDLDHIGVKAPQFSFTRLRGADPRLGVEMLSTGEVACIDRDYHAGFLKALQAADNKIPINTKNNPTFCLSINARYKSMKIIESVKKLKRRGVRFAALSKTHSWLMRNGLTSARLYIPRSSKKSTITDWLNENKINLVINITSRSQIKSQKNGVSEDYKLRRQAADLGIPLITDLNTALTYLDALIESSATELEIKALDEYK